MNIALQAKGLAANGMNHRVAITAQFGVLIFEPVDQFKRLGCGLCFKHFPKQFIETLCAVRLSQAGFNLLPRRRASVLRRHF